MSEQANPAASGPTIKKFMFVNRKAPYGSIYALESLEVVLITATFDQDVSLVFIDDGVYELVKGQQTKGIGIKNFSPSYRALDGYDVEKLYVDQASLDSARPHPRVLALLNAERALRLDRLGSVVSSALGSRGVHEPGLVSLVGSFFCF